MADKLGVLDSLLLPLRFNCWYRLASEMKVRKQDHRSAG